MFASAARITRRSTPRDRAGQGSRMPGHVVATVCVTVGVALSGLPLCAQAVSGSPAFEFTPHLISLSVRGGYDRPLGGSDIYAFTRQFLTLERGALAAGAVHADVGVRLTNRVDVVATAGAATQAAASEFRDFIDNNDQPIEQTTRLRRVPFTIGLRYALHPSGERIGRFIWIPARVSTWVGAGGGAMHYAFSQFGDFVDFRTMNVFRQRLGSRGWTPMAYANLGADLRMSHNFWLTGDLRYSAARAPLRGSFYGFDRIDLSGIAASMGVTVRR
jgi:hypothetical protein